MRINLTLDCGISKYLSVFALLMTIGHVAKAQLPEYNMSDTTLTDCQGRLFDSGGPSAIYGVSEHLTTVISTQGTISLVFVNQFCLENLDTLYVYNGPSSASPLLGAFTGNTLPGTLTATSGAATLVMSSDNTASYCGFTMEWTSNVPAPIPPAIVASPQPTCGAQQIDMIFSYPVNCDWLDNAIWTGTVNGQNLGITGVTYNCVNGLSSTAVLALSQPINTNCSYALQLTIQIPDFCGNIYEFNVNSGFNFTGCPLDASISSTAFGVCPGSCAEITAIANGCSAFTFQWDNGLPPTAGPHTVCPNFTTTYTVVVTEVNTGLSVTRSFTLEVNGHVITTPPQTICQSAPDIVMQTAEQGVWSGDGLELDTNIFDPDSVVNGGSTFVYFDNGLCLDSVEFIILPIQTEDIIAACPNSGAFQLEAEPTGGIWSGPHTTSSGMFDPLSDSTYTVLYSLGTCVDTLTINVAAISGVFELDTICQSVWFDTLSIQPFGGYWDGAGILDSLLGIFVPAGAPAGDLYLGYHLHGCEQIVHRFIKEINVGPSYETACPLQAPLVYYGSQLAPANGYWTGVGITDPSTGLFDPAIVGNDTWTSLIYYAPNGCSDSTFVYVRQTEIGLDSISMCLSDGWLYLNESTVQNAPPWGNNLSWSGTGVAMDANYVWYFDPAIAGPGMHNITFTVNTCSDQIVAVVYPDGLQNHSASFCSNDAAVVLDSSPTLGGTWIGSGITNAHSGLFSPANSDTGNHYVYWETSAGCRDSIDVFVEGFVQASLGSLEDFYCFRDSLVTIDVQPPGGVITGVNADYTFIASELGEGTHHITYVYDGPECHTSTAAIIDVGPPISVDLTVADSIICQDAGTVLSATATGGNPNGTLTYHWPDGSFGVSNNSITLETTTMEYVVVEDGCSDPGVDSVLVTVTPHTFVDVLTSDTLCFGDEGFAQAIINSPGNFQVYWDNVEATEIVTQAGSTHHVVVIGAANGCDFDSTIFVPSFPPISAGFSINPNLGCIPWDQASAVSFIDLSQNAVAGVWDFGNGNSQPYVDGDFPIESYDNPGYYEISLIVQNIGECADTAYGQVCILPDKPIFIPEAFSPNGDGNNDVLFVRSMGIISMEFDVYNRWGERMFHSTTVDNGWDGRHNGRLMPSGNYLYILNAKLNDGSDQILKGEVTLVK